jgi:PIN domain nuclease of toxin-antitoxin system
VLKQTTPNFALLPVQPNLTIGLIQSVKNNNTTARLVALKPDIVEVTAKSVTQQNLKISELSQSQKFVLALVTRLTLGYGSSLGERILVRINRNVVQGAAIQSISKFAILSLSRIFQTAHQYLK